MDKSEKWSSIKDPRHNGLALAELLAVSIPHITSSSTGGTEIVTITFSDHRCMTEAYQLLLELLVTGQRL